MIEVWPPILVAGVAFAIPQYLISNYHGPWLVDVVAAIVLDGVSRAVPQSLAAGHSDDRDAERPVASATTPSLAHTHLRCVRACAAWTPWLILAVFVFLWGTPQVRLWLDGIWIEKVPVVGLARAGAADAARGRSAAHRKRRL